MCGGDFMLKTQLRPIKIIETLLDILVFSLFPLAVVLGLLVYPALEYLGVLVTDEGQLTVSLISLALVFPVVVYVRVRHHKKYESWSIEDDQLIRGKDRNLVIDLHSIQAAAVGLPINKTKHRFVNLYAHKEVLERNSEIDWTLLLKLSDREFFPLYLYPFNGGDKLMEYMYQFLELKFGEPYTLSIKEKQALKKCKVNKLFTME